MRDDTDPVETAVVEFPCEVCNRGQVPLPRYFDAKGVELYLS